MKPIGLEHGPRRGAIRPVGQRRGVALGGVGAGAESDIGWVSWRAIGLAVRYGRYRCQRTALHGMAAGGQCARSAPVSTGVVRPSPGAIARRDVAGRQRVADVLVGPGLGEDDATDRAVGEDERAAAVAAIDLGAQLEDLASDLSVAVDVEAGGRDSGPRPRPARRQAPPPG